MRHVRSLLALLPPLLLLAACFSGLNSKSPTQQRYVLQLPATQTAETTASAAPAAPAAPAVGTLQVMRPSAAPGLASEGIAVLRPGARLDYYSNARWAADAPSALQNLVIESLRQAGRFTMVEAEGGPFASQYLLSLDLTHFEARYGADGAPTIEVELVASLGRRSDRSMLRTLTAHGSVPAGADRMQAVIAAFEQATGEALAQIGAGVAPTP